MRHTFEQVRRAIKKQWGHELTRASGTDERDGRWDVTHSRTGFLVSGAPPGCKYQHRRYRSLSEIVLRFELEKVIKEQS